jgi:PAS domain S-box-containing protein
VRLDMNMPGLTGEETCHRLKATPALRRVPVILMTAREDRQAIVDALNAGADDFVPKSNDVAVLTARLRAQLRRKQSEDEKERIQQELAQKQLEAAQAASDRELAETRAVLLKDLEQKNEELSRATRQAIQSEARFRLLVEGVKDYAIFMMDTQGRIESWNPGAENITGYRSEEMVGQPFSLLYPPEDVQASRPQQTLGHATTHGVCEEEAPRVRKDGTRFWAEAALRAVRDKAGQLVGFVEVIRDVTERKRAQEEREDLLRNLQQALTTRDDFLSIASHELKTPLTSLRLQLDSLERIRAKAPPEVADQLHRKADVLRRQIGRLTQLINNLLDVSNISSRRLKLELEDVELSALVREVAGRFEEELERAGCRLVLDTPADAVVGRWDRLHVDQVITNLLSNALKYGPGRPIEISVACDNGLARLRIRDHGIGIHPDHQRRVFERFERAVSDRHYGGFGLGLWISRQIVEGLGGSIAVQSQPGEGSAFTVALPLAGPGADLLPLDFTETVSARQ